VADLSYTGAFVLHAIRSGRRYGFQIMEAGGFPSGTVYPALRKLEASRLIRSRWEPEAIARAEQRPARKYYEISRAGESALTAAQERFRFPILADDCETAGP
jgi:DNA-binding PadR family transcriptional regulator